MESSSSKRDRWNESLWAQITAWLERAYPQEGCGLILEDEAGDWNFRGCDNVIDRYHEVDPEQYPRTSDDFYMIDPREFMAADDRGQRVAVIVHSHPDTGHYFSDADEAAALMPQASAEEAAQPVYPGADYLVVSVHEATAVGAALYRFEPHAGGFERVREFRDLETITSVG